MARSKTRSLVIVSMTGLIAMVVVGLYFSQSRLPPLSLVDSCVDCDSRLRHLGLTQVVAISVASRDLAGSVLTLRQHLQDSGYKVCADESIENGTGRLLRFSQIENPSQFITAVVTPVCVEPGCGSESQVEIHLSSVNLRVVSLLFPKVSADLCDPRRAGVNKSGVAIAPLMSTGPTKLLPYPGLLTSPADLLSA